MAVTIVKNTGSVYAEYDNVKETFPISIEGDTSTTGQVLTLDNGSLVGGTGYSDDTDVATTGGTGSGLTVDITTAAGVVTAVVVNQAGVGYTAGDTITITTGNADATIDVDTITENTVAISGRVVTGSLSLFTSEARVGDWIWLKTNDELRRIEAIGDDGRLILETEATTEAASFYGIVKREGFNSVGYSIDDVDSANINTISMPKNISETFRTDLRFIPILIDSTPNANKVILSAKNW